MNSALFVGRVRHRRHEPVTHEFSYRIHMLYLDLAEIDRVFRDRWLWSSRRPAIARFRRDDHFGDPAIDLDTAVRALVEARSGRRPTGPIRLLTQLRYFGYCFNPVSFYYCFDATDSHIETIVAEVNNTPWGERHCYVLGESANGGSASVKRYKPAKAFHVSPFLPMNVDYDWRFSTPATRLSVHMHVAVADRRLFDATLALERVEIATRSLAGALASFPPMSLRIIMAIYWQALRLWLKRVPVYDHPAVSAPSIRIRPEGRQ